MAEDEPDIADLLKLLLEQDGCEVVIARDGRAALELTREWHPSIAFIDVYMPEIDGYELTRRIRADDSLRGMRIIIVSATVKEGVVEESLAAGADDYLEKPFTAHQIRAQIAQSG